MTAITVTAIDDTDGEYVRRQTSTAKRGIRGAAGGVYVGPILSHATAAENADASASTVTHAVAGGGVEDTTGARESDTYAPDGVGTGGLTGGASSSVSRPTGRTAFIGAGVVGGSTPGNPVDRTGRAEDTGVDRFGRSLTGDAYGEGGGGRFTYTNFDGRSDLSGDGGRALGSAGRGTNTDLETVVVRIPRPTAGTSANPSAGTVALVQGDDKFQVDLHADDITGGASGYKGARIALYTRGSDTDDDGQLVGVVDADGGTDITDAFTGLVSGATYAFYAWFRYAAADGSVHLGPRSARGTVATS